MRKNDMQRMHWLESHLGSIQEAITVANEFFWELSIREGEQTWTVTSGADAITVFTTNSHDALDAFLYGMGLAITGIPDWIFESVLVILMNSTASQRAIWHSVSLNSSEDAKAIANEFLWELSVKGNEQTWFVTTGMDNIIIFSTDSREALNAFLYGMGLAYKGIPASFFEQVKLELKKWYKTL